MLKLFRIYHTLKYLKPVQIYSRVWFRISSPRPDLSPSPSVRKVSEVWKEPTQKQTCLIRPWTFRFLNSSHDCQFPVDWNNGELGKLWLYNLHYFDELLAADAAKSADWHRELVERWIVENPPGHGNGWEPYPMSLRIVNWVKWALAGNTLPAEFNQSLAVQARHLRKRLEYHLLGNHLFANAKALVFAGLYFKGPVAKQWLRKGLVILHRQVAEQILSDGGHFERSPMYHAIILEDVLDLVNLFQAYGKDLPGLLNQKIPSMCQWLACMSHPDGNIGLFNDAALKIAAEPWQLYDYANRLGGGCENGGLVEQGVHHLKESGYIRWKSPDVCMLMDVGEIGPDYLPGHAHADTLSFEMSLLGQRFIVDSGTSCYGVSEERLRQRQTAAHNTVTVDGEDSSEVWGGFRVARRARPRNLAVNENKGTVVVHCSHDGFRRLPGKVVHNREWALSESQVSITDTLTGGYNSAFGHLFFHPAVQLENVGDGCYRAMLSDGHVATIEILGGNAELLQATYHPEFGVAMANQCLRISFSTNQCQVHIRWQ
jgi:uncharacterized heparinase superfamily protein